MKSLLTVNELSDYFKVSRDTVYKWIRQGMPYQELPNGHKRFYIMDVVDWFDRVKESGE